MTLHEIETALGIVAVFLALVAAVLFILMVVVGELVVIARLGTSHDAHGTAATGTAGRAFDARCWASSLVTT